jgi:hypothetical protein
MTTRESLSHDFYGYLKHPSGLILPKLLRDQLQQTSSKQNGEENEDITITGSIDTSYEEPTLRCHRIQNRERHWTVTEIVDMMNATAQKIQNLQTQIINGEDYYVNHVTSISVYNSKNNYSDSTTFLDSKTDVSNSHSYNYPSGSNTGGNATTSSHGTSSSSTGNHQQHRWFSNSFTTITPYQQTIPYPIIPRKEKLSVNPGFSFISSSAPIVSTETHSTAEAAAVAQWTDIMQPTPASTTETTAASSKDMSVNTLPKRGRSSNAQAQAPPTRRSTKRRRKAS